MVGARQHLLAELISPHDQDAWEGYGVVQAKYLNRSRNSSHDGNWAIEQLNLELQKYLEPDSKRKKPEYFIYATNVVLTPVSGTGSKDKIIAILEDFKK